MRSRTPTLTPGAAGLEPTPRKPRASRARRLALGPVLESIVDAVVVADHAGRIVLCNEAAKRILGPIDIGESWATAAERHGLFLSDRSAPCSPDQLPLMRALGGETVAEVEVFVRNPGNPEGIWVSVSGTPWLDDAGRVRGAISIYREITARRQADETVRRLSMAVEQTADCVVITDREGRIEYVNSGFERTTGYARDEVLGLTPRLLRSGRHDPGFYEEMWRTLTSGDVFRGTLVNRKKSGQPYYAEQTITPMRDGTGEITHFVSVGKDLTDRRRATEREIELRLAGEVQRRLYPGVQPHVPGLDVAGGAFPTATMCGDYFDHFPMRENRLGLVVADVSGHGFGPALIMTETRACLRSHAQALLEPDDILRRLNAMLLQDLDSGSFVTMLFGCLDVRDRTLTYVNAGHPSGFVLDGSGATAHVLESTTLPLGIRPDLAGLARTTVPLEPGSLIVLLTDGILESRSPDGDLYGEENVLAIVRRHRQAPAAEILERLYQGARAFQRNEPQTDDLTAVICKLAVG